MAWTASRACSHYRDTYFDAAVLGAYNITVEEPFGKLLKLPTVVVNVTDDGQDGEYDFAIMYATASDQPSTSVTLQSCDTLQLLLQAGCDEAQHRASRSPAADSSRIASMIALAQQMRIPFRAADEKIVDWRACPLPDRSRAA